MEDKINVNTTEMTVKEDLMNYTASYLRDKSGKRNKLYILMAMVVSLLSSIVLWKEVVIPSKDFFEIVTFKDSLFVSVVVLLLVNFSLKVLDRFVISFFTKRKVKDLEKELNTYCDMKYHNTYDVVLDKYKAKEFFSIYFSLDNVVKLLSAINLRLEKSEFEK